MDGDVYIVRGAVLRCHFGSHPRRLNLPKCHGVYATGHPLVHELDCEPGEAGNIPSFGVCESPTAGSDAPVVTLQRVECDEGGRPIGTGGNGGTVRGRRCMPLIPEKRWRNTYTDTRIVDNGDRDPADRDRDDDDEDKGHPAVTTSSFVYCARGGVIRPVTSGQEGM